MSTFGTTWHECPCLILCPDHGECALVVNKVKRSMKAVRVVVGERQRIKRTLLKERQMDERRLNRETLEVDTSSSEARYD